MPELIAAAWIGPVVPSSLSAHKGTQRSLPTSVCDSSLLPFLFLFLSSFFSTSPPPEHASPPKRDGKSFTATAHHITSWLTTTQDKLILTTLGTLAQRRLARGLILNRAETIALISSQLQEFIRDGRHSVAELMDMGKKMLGRRHVRKGVPESIHSIQVEGTFPDGVFLVTVDDPISSDDGDC